MNAENALLLHVHGLSGRLNRATKSVHVCFQGKVIAVLVNTDRFHAANFSRSVNARRRVYLKNIDHLVTKASFVTLPSQFDGGSVQAVFGKFGSFEPIVLPKSTYGQSCVCISPKDFRLIVRHSLIKSSQSKEGQYLNGLPVLRNSGTISFYGDRVLEWSK